MSAVSIEVLKHVQAFLNRVTHWQEGNPDLHDTKVMVRQAIEQAERDVTETNCVDMQPYGWIGFQSGKFIKNAGQKTVQGTPLYLRPTAPAAWKNAAIRLGEELSSVGPSGYYDMTAEQWLNWAMSQQPRGKNSLLAAQPAPVQDIGVEQDERVFARIEARKNRDAAHKETAPAQQDETYQEAKRLAEWLFKTHYASEEDYASGRVVWEVLDTTQGVLSQIDNMVCRLVKPPRPSTDLVNDLRKRAYIRRQISTRKSVQEGKPDRIAYLLEEAANVIDSLRAALNKED